MDRVVQVNFHFAVVDDFEGRNETASQKRITAVKISMVTLHARVTHNSCHVISRADSPGDVKLHSVYVLCGPSAEIAAWRGTFT